MKKYYTVLDLIKLSNIDPIVDDLSNLYDRKRVISIIDAVKKNCSSPIINKPRNYQLIFYPSYDLDKDEIVDGPLLKIENITNQDYTNIDIITHTLDELKKMEKVEKEKLEETLFSYDTPYPCYISIDDVVDYVIDTRLVDLYTPDECLISLLYHLLLPNEYTGIEHRGLDMMHCPQLSLFDLDGSLVSSITILELEGKINALNLIFK